LAALAPAAMDPNQTGAGGRPWPHHHHSR
jgi:hypothetical protein